MNWSIVINAVFIVCMAVGIVVVWRLQKTLNGLNKSRLEMEKFVADFSGSIARAQKAINDLQQTARDVGEDVENHLSRAQGLRDELTFLVEAADKIATRLTDSTASAQNDAKASRNNRSEKQNEKSVESKADTKPLSSIQEVQKQKAETVINSPAAKAEVAPQPVQAKTVPLWAKRAEPNGPVINAPVEAAAPVSGLQFGKKPVQKSPEPLANSQPAKEEEQLRSLAERELQQALEKMK
ncbi:MAG: DUF6468 domain-containing protein [Alphaproteobacteria bacterium]|nr:DUF6468 domain-containing protein [Alphaproteobacteria bacterium]